MLRGVRSFKKGTLGSISQLAAKLQAVKVGGLKKILPRSMSRGGPGSTPGRWDHPPTLTACNFTAS